MARLAGLLYAFLAFGGTWGFFICFILFLGNLPRESDPWLSVTIDVGPEAPPWSAVVWNAVLVALFGLRHSVMARPRFKQCLRNLLPPELERATYVHAGAVLPPVA